MADIFIQKVRKEDDFNTIVDVINKNFEEIIAAGGGPRGDRGYVGTGIPGRPGLKGDLGTSGKDGTIWYVSTEDPGDLNSKVPTDFNADFDFEFIILNPLSGAFYGYKEGSWSNVEYLGDPNTATPFSRNEHDQIGGKDFIVPKNTADNISAINIYNDGSNLQSNPTNAASSETTYGHDGAETTYPLTTGAIFPAPTSIAISPKDFKLVLGTYYDANSVGTGPVAPLMYLANTGKYNAGNDGNMSAWAIGISEDDNDDYALLKFMRTGATKEHFYEFSGNKFIANSSSVSPEVVAAGLSTSSSIYGADVLFDYPGSMLVPKGTTAERPTVTSDGMLRYNTTITAFEGRVAGNWISLGGVRDVDGDTYIELETGPGNDEDILYFYCEGLPMIEIKANQNTDAAIIQSPDTATSNQPTDIEIYPGSDGASLSGNLILAHDGSGQRGMVSIATVEPNYSLDVSGATDGIRFPSGLTNQRPTGTDSELRGVMRFNTQLQALELFANTSWRRIDGERLQDLDGDTYIRVEEEENDDDNIYFYTGGTQAGRWRLRSKSNGSSNETNPDLLINGSLQLIGDSSHPNGIEFPELIDTSFGSTPVISRTLDDYKIGEVSNMVVRALSGSTLRTDWLTNYTENTDSRSGRYVKIGESVNVQLKYRFGPDSSAITNSFDVMEFALPFTARDDGQDQYLNVRMTSTNSGDTWPANATSMVMYIEAGTGYAIPKFIETDGDEQNVDSGNIFADVVSGSTDYTFEFTVWGTYFTEARVWDNAQIAGPGGGLG